MKNHLLWTTVLTINIGLCAPALGSDDPASSWTYEAGNGPDSWGSLKSEYAFCATGKTQSPIDIAGAVEASLPRVTFAYRPGDATVLNNGHTLQVSPVDASEIALPAGEFQLLQAHFHTPSEEIIEGRPYPLGAHFVTRNTTNELAVVALQFEEGTHNPALESLFAGMPATSGGMTTVPMQTLIDLLPENRRHYAFMGSLTTPPCSEGVRWQVLAQPVQLSTAQLQAFRALFPMNARPVQPLNGRQVQVGG